MAEEGFSIKLGNTKLKAPVFILAGMFLLIVLVISFSGSNTDPSITGGTVAANSVVIEEPVVEEVIVVQDNSEELASLQTELTTCQAALSELQVSETTLESYWQAQNDKEEKKYDTELEIKEEQLQDSLTTNWQTIENAADSICCKEKVDDSSIDSFKVENDMIICGVSLSHDIEC